MAIAKLLLLLPVAIALQYVLMPPNAHPPSAEELREERGFERRLPYIIVFLRIMFGGWATFEGLVLFALSGHCPPALFRPFLHVLLGPLTSNDPTTTTASVFAALKTPSFSFVSGATFLLAGFLLRAHTFRVLGPRFTFELSIRGTARAYSPASHSIHDPAPTKAHALVTHGVYGIIRHPSYTGGLMMHVGWCLCLLDRQGSTAILASASFTWFRSWWCSYGCEYALWLSIHDTTAMTAALACLWVMILAPIWVIIDTRIDREDAMLEKHFGEEWRTWAKRVHWRLMPGVY